MEERKGPWKNSIILTTNERGLPCVLDPRTGQEIGYVRAVHADIVAGKLPVARLEFTGLQADHVKLRTKQSLSPADEKARCLAILDACPLNDGHPQIDAWSAGKAKAWIREQIESDEWPEEGERDGGADGGQGGEEAARDDAGGDGQEDEDFPADHSTPREAGT